VSKSEKVKCFAGGLYTTTVEGFILAMYRKRYPRWPRATGRGAGEKKKAVHLAKKKPRGLSTRTIGVTAMVHGDNQGLVLPPPKVANQVVIIPCARIITETSEEESRKTRTRRVRSRRVG
jgi:hypothetical protein